MACEKCWGDAYKRSMVDGRAQSDHYLELLEERRATPCTVDEQAGYNSGECCLASHANAKAPWTCPCACHDRRSASRTSVECKYHGTMYGYCSECARLGVGNMECPHCEAVYSYDELHPCADTQESS